MQEMSYDHITEACLAALENETLSALSLLEELMDTPGVPMHDPVHHYIMPAVLLTMATKFSNNDINLLRMKLAVAEERARKLLPGFCGWWGACGAAVGCGVFASVWLEASPKKEGNWAQINLFTSRCLARVSSVDGPRCCKRTSYLALLEAISAAREIFRLDLGVISKPCCTWSGYNNECRKQGCPFFSSEKSCNVHKHLNYGIGPVPDERA